MLKIKTLTFNQQQVVDAIKNKGARLYASYPMPFRNIDSRLELGKSIQFINVSTFKSLINRKIIGNPKPKTNRHYEYFLINATLTEYNEYINQKQK